MQLYNYHTMKMVSIQTNTRHLCESRQPDWTLLCSLAEADQAVRQAFPSGLYVSGFPSPFRIGAIFAELPVRGLAEAVWQGKVFSAWTSLVAR